MAATKRETAAAWKEYALDERRRANAAEAKLIMNTAELTATQNAMQAAIKTWDSLKPGQYDKDIWETWLIQKMKPAIDTMRSVAMPFPSADYDGLGRCDICKQAHSPNGPCP